MATLEKLNKTLEALKITLASAHPSEESVIKLRHKEKVSLCMLVTDMICTTDTRNSPKFPPLLSYSMETLLQMCDDSDSNIRIIADECLNRIIRTTMDPHIVKIHIELHKEIKKNGSVRSLRAALWRFAELAHLIRPQKGRPFVKTLVPCIISIAKRKEEPLLETLSTSIPKIFSALGCFTFDNEIKNLLEVFLQNISSDNVVIRRTAAASILAICLNCSKTQFFLVHTLNTLLDMVLPVKEEESSNTILGVLNCIRSLLGELEWREKETILRGSFGVKRKTCTQAAPSVDSMIQVYELCLHWTSHPENNVVTGALETLNQLLSTAPPQLITVLNSSPLTRSRIHAMSAMSVKFSQRTLSQLSVAGSVFGTSDEPSLLDIEEITPSSKLSQWLDESVPLQGQQEPSNFQSFLSSIVSSQSSFYTDEAETESLCSEDLGPIVKQPVEKPQSPEPESIRQDSPSPPPTTTSFNQVWDIGEVVDSNQITLVYCARRLVSAFLIPEVPVRVSTRALALNCLGQVLRMYPEVFSMSIDRFSQSSPSGLTRISDVLTFATHSDQQLRGLTCMLIGNLMMSTIRNSLKTSPESGSKNIPCEQPNLPSLIQIFVNGLKDESSVCVRHTLASLSTCLEIILESEYCFLAKPVLEQLVLLTDNSYWLVKVKLIELVGGLSFQSVFHIMGSSDYQNQVIHHVLLPLLGDKDNRVRTSASEALINLIDNLYFPTDFGSHDAIIARSAVLSSNIFAGSFDENTSNLVNPLFGVCENSLSRIVQLLSTTLLESSSKNVKYGAVEALSLLSEKYPPTQYPMGWQCFLQIPEKDSSNLSASCGLLATTLACLTSSSLSLDLGCHQKLLILAGNLFNGLCMCSINYGKPQDSTDIIWSCITDRQLANLAESLLFHVLRIMFMYVKVVDESAQYVRPQNVATASPFKRRSPRAPSPTKIHSTPEKDDILKEEKSKYWGSFAHIPHYNKMYEVIRSSYTNYKITLEPGACEKFIALIHSVLTCLERVLEYSTVSESGRLAKDVLQYLKITFAFDAAATMRIVNQLLKSLFEPLKLSENHGNSPGLHPGKPCIVGFYSHVILLPLQNLSSYLDTNTRSLLQLEGWESEPRSDKPNPLQNSCNRATLAAHIKLFEPIVIQALQEYTKTSKVELQVQVLKMLTKLVELKVNYCLLDSDQVFIQFVLKQFEFLEAGQIQHAELLIPQLFQFLVRLSNEKNHSKPVISFSKVIQLCDGLMACGQNPLTHCIPALKPVVEHIFLMPNSYVNDVKELDTQREVMLAMMIKLAEYPQVLDMLLKVMKEGWRWQEHWKRWYRLTIDSLFPLLSEGRLLITDVNSLYSLISLSTNFFAPLNKVLTLLFCYQQDGQKTVHWLGMVTTMLLAATTYREDMILLQLASSNLYVRDEGDDPLNVNAVSKTVPPEILLAKLILRIIKTISVKLNEEINSCVDSEEIESLEKMFSVCLLCCVHIISSGNFEEFSKALNICLASDDLYEINDLLVRICGKCPIPNLLWICMLCCLKQGDLKLWNPYMTKEDSLNHCVVKRGAILFYCDFISKCADNLKQLQWLLNAHIKDIIFNCQEPLVQNLLTSISNKPDCSNLMLDSISNVVTSNDPVFTHRLLKCLENIHPEFTGRKLKLVVLTLLEHQNVAITRIASAFCSRAIEYLLTLDQGAVLEQISQEDLTGILDSLSSSQRQSQRHKGLLNLLNKLNHQCYGTVPYEIEYGSSVNAANIRSIVVNQNWYLQQVKDKCCNLFEMDGKKCARLLSSLQSQEVETVFENEQFNRSIFQHCFSLGTQLTLKHWAESSESDIYKHLSPIYKVSLKYLMKFVEDVCKSVIVSSDLEENYQYLESLLQKDNIFQESLFPMVSTVTNFLATLSDIAPEPNQFNSLVPKKCIPNLTTFGVICFQYCKWICNNTSSINNWPTQLQSLLECSASIFKLDSTSSMLTYGQINLISSTVIQFIETLTKNKVVLKTLKDATSEQIDFITEVCLKMTSLLNWLETMDASNIPYNLTIFLKSIIVSLAKNPLVNWACRIPVEVWSLPLSIESPPPLSQHFLHDSDILDQIVRRLCTIGWSGKLQYAETWVCLLGALSPHPDIENTDQEEIAAIMQANSIAVNGITLLVLSSLAPNSDSSNTFLHVPRLSPTPVYALKSWKRLEELNNTICWRLNRMNSPGYCELVRIDKRCNPERVNDSSTYGFGQLSVSYLQVQITPPEERGNCDNEMRKLCELKEKSLVDSGLDVRSCVQFTVDLFSQWVLPNSGISLNVQLSMIKSILCMSDLFSERTHYVWMLSTFLELSRVHPSHDEVLHQYLIIGIGKAYAVLNNFDLETNEKVIRAIDSGLKSSFAPMRNASIHSLLYLVQTLRHIKSPEPGSDLTKLPAQDFKTKIVAICLDVIHRQLGMYVEQSEESLLALSLVFYMLECFPQESIDALSIIKTISVLVRSPKDHRLYRIVMQGLERLVLIGRPDLNENITRLALDRLGQSNPCVTLPALQLLLACIYTDSQKEAGSPDSDKGLWTMEIMEKTSALFDRIKKGYPVEVELICEILPGILSDFFSASDILTKVISEFLSPNQPHKRQMAAMVFQLFSQVCSEQQLSLLQDWVVHSLSNFITNLPIIMAVWSLCCFFISASTNPWLKALFPHVQSRIRQCEYEDRKLFCIAALDFYNHLNAKQQELFLQSFKDSTSSQRGPFADVIACLQP